MPFAEVNGQNIHYQDTGGDGPAIILSHGFGMGHEMWVHQIDPLVGAGWRVVTYDERSWGQTTHTEPFDYWDLAADVIALMDHLGIDQAVLGGMSQGGFLSMRAALATPERVRALVLVDTEAEVYSDEDRAQFQALFDAAIAMGLTGEVGDVLAMTLFGQGFAVAFDEGFAFGLPRRLGLIVAQQPVYPHDAARALVGQQHVIDERVEPVALQPGLVIDQHAATAQFPHEDLVTQRLSRAQVLFGLGNLDGIGRTTVRHCLLVTGLAKVAG